MSYTSEYDRRVESQPQKSCLSYFFFPSTEGSVVKYSSIVLEEIMLLYVLPLACIITFHTAQIGADGDFLQPWTAGRNKDYSDNINYAVGTNIITQWSTDSSTVSIDLVQDNHPGS